MILNKRITKRILLISICILLVLCFAACNKEQPTVYEVDSAEFISHSASGYNEYGNCIASVDYEKMLTDIFINIQIDDNLKSKCRSIISSKDFFNVKLSKDSMLKNDEQVTVTVEVNPEKAKELKNLINVNVNNGQKLLTIQGLDPTVEVNVFDGLFVDAENSINGQGSINCQVAIAIDEEEVIYWPVTHNGTNGSISNEDVLTLKISDEIDINEFTKSTGIKIAKTEDQYIVRDLKMPIVDGSILSTMSSVLCPEMDVVIEEWVVSCLNDQRSNAMKRQYRLVGYVLYTDELNNDLLIGIYAIQDARIGLDKEYYVFVGIQDDLWSVYNHVTLKDKQLPTSFVYYEKETVRYTEQGGWGQYSEDMGFLFDGKYAFAGHMKLAETFSYLETTYGGNYQHMYVQEVFADEAPERAEVVKNVRKH